MSEVATDRPSRAGRGGTVAGSRLDDAALAVDRGRTLRLAITLGAVALLAWVVYGAATNPRFEWGVVREHFTSRAILSGLVTSLWLATVLLIFGVVLGTLLALARNSGLGPLQWFAWIYSWVFRAVPALVQLIFWYNLAYLFPNITLSIPFGPEFFSVSTNAAITPFLAAVLGLGLCEAAYMSEVIRAGLMSVPEGQRDAARSIGFTRTATFFRIILPQSMRFILPPLGSQAILMLKATSLVSVIALSDLLHSAQTVYNRTLEVVPLLMVATLWYLILVSILSVGQIALERHFNRGHTRPQRRTRQTGGVA